MRISARGAGQHTGRDVVLVHGLGASSRYMVPLLRALAPHALVLAPDLPGFGRSPGPRHALDVASLTGSLAAWMDTTGLADALVIGNSLGCQVALALGVERPDLVGGLVLDGPTVDVAHRRVLPQLLRLVVDVPHERASLVPVLLRDYLDCGPRRLLGTLRHALADRPEDRLAQVRVPTLVVRGERDPLVTRDWAETVTALLPDAALREVPGGGHATNYSDAAALAHLALPLLGPRATP